MNRGIATTGCSTEWRVLPVEGFNKNNFSAVLGYFARQVNTVCAPNGCMKGQLNEKAREHEDQGVPNDQPTAM